MRLGVATTASLIALFASGPARAVDWTATVAVVSDYVAAGISLSDRHGALQAGVDVAGPAGLFGGIYLSSVDFPPATPEGSGRKFETALMLGYNRAFSDSISAALYVIYYGYPDVRPSERFDYAETTLAFYWRDRVTALVAYAADAFGQGERAVTGDVAVRWPLRQGTKAVTGVGTYRLSGELGEPYWYWTVGVVQELGGISLDLSWVDASAAAERLFGDAAAGRWVVKAVAKIP